MAVPPNAVLITQQLDPGDVELIAYNIPQGANQLLNTGEGIASFTLSVTAEAAAAGLTIVTTGGYTTQITGLQLTFYVSIAAGHQSDALFDGAGALLGVVLTITTNATPARIKQKTIGIQWAQQ